MYRNRFIKYLYEYIASYVRDDLSKYGNGVSYMKNIAKNILIIADLLFQDAQESIVARLCQTAADHINVYVKPHPLDNMEPYKKLKELIWLMA